MKRFKTIFLVVSLSLLVSSSIALGTATTLSDVTQINDLIVFNGKFYASTGEGCDGEANVYESTNGTDWNKVFTLNNQENIHVLFYDASAVDGNLYIGTGKRGCNPLSGARIYRYDGSGIWPLDDDWVLDLGLYHRIDDIIYFNGYFYVATGGANEWPNSGAARIYRSPTGDRGTWEAVFYVPEAYIFNGFAIYNSKLYVASGDDKSSGVPGIAKIFSTTDGIIWQEEFYTSYIYVSELVEYEGKLYANAFYTPGYPVNFNQYGTIYVYDGFEWGDLKTNITEMPLANYFSMSVYNNKLYIGTGAVENGLKGVIYSFDGTSWVLEIDLPTSEPIRSLSEFEAKLYAAAGKEIYDLSPVPDIKANSSDGPLTIPRSDILRITVSLAPGIYGGNPADWWVLAKTPMGWYYRNLSTNSWKPGQTVTKQGPLLAVSNYQVLNQSGLPVGTYEFYFGVDLNMNGLISYGTLYYDKVVVNVTP